MNSRKIRKSFLKRFKLTKRNFLLRRKSGVSHFKAKKVKDLKRGKRKLVTAAKDFIKYSYYL